MIKELFYKFEILDIYQVVNYYEKNNGLNESYHYHVLLRKV